MRTVTTRPTSFPGSRAHEAAPRERNCRFPRLNVNQTYTVAVIRPQNPKRFGTYSWEWVFFTIGIPTHKLENRHLLQMLLCMQYLCETNTQFRFRIVYDRSRDLKSAVLV
jgi:hypothetical protein